MFNTHYIEELIDGYHLNPDSFDEDTLEEIMDYVDDHQDDQFEYSTIVAPYGEPQINRWLTKRLKVGSGPKTVGLYYQPKHYSLKANHTLQEILKSKLRLSHYMPRRTIWRIDVCAHRHIKDAELSLILSRTFHRNIQVQSRNVWTYLAKKGRSKFRGHQEQFWHEAYRKYRWYYANYFDIVNSIALIGIVKGAEHLFLHIVHLVMPAIYEPKSIKRYLRFIDAVIKNIPQIQRQFRVFKLLVTGKLAGGSKRTKSMGIGYGKLPIQTLSLNAEALTSAYTHTFGEFGLKLVLCRNSRLATAKLRRVQALLDSKRPNRKRQVLRTLRAWRMHRIRSKPLFKVTQALRKIAHRRATFRKLQVKKNEWLRAAYITTKQRKWHIAKIKAVAKRHKTLIYKRSRVFQRTFHRPHVRWVYPIEYPRYRSNRLRTLLDIARNDKIFPGPRFQLVLPRVRPLSYKQQSRGKRYYKKSHYARIVRMH